MVVVGGVIPLVKLPGAVVPSVESGALAQSGVASRAGRSVSCQWAVGSVLAVMHHF